MNVHLDKWLASRAVSLRARHLRLNRSADVVARYVIFLVAGFAIWMGGAAPVIATMIAWPLCVGLEILVHRPRPFQALHRAPLAKYWTPTPSFPSAHATIAFALSGGAWIEDPRAWPLFLFSIAIAAARVYAGVHYFSDVLAGALIGFGVSWALHTFV